MAKHRARRCSILVVTYVVALIGASLGCVAVAQTGGFVQKHGLTLVLDGRQWIAKGWNDYRLTDTFEGYACNPGRGPLTDAQLATLFDQIGSTGATVVRTWFFQSYYQGQANHWAAFDRVLAAASVAGVKVIPVLVNQWQACEASGVDKNHAFYQQAYQQPGLGYPLSFLNYAKTVTAHYKDSRTVAFWEIANEPETSNRDGGGGYECPVDAASVLKTFADTVTAAIKSQDPNHLVSLGTLGSGQCGTQGSQYADVHAGAVDICSYHDFDADTVPLPDDGFNRLRQRLDQCRLLGKPIYIGEAGIAADVAATGGSSCGPVVNCITNATLSRRAGMFGAKVDAAFAQGAAGYLIWEKIPEASNSQVNNDNGRFGVGPDDPTNDVIRTCCGSGGDVPADFDGNGTTDVSVFRPSTGAWLIRNQATVFHGINSDVPVPCDYDGNGATDIAVFRPSVGGWYVAGQSPTFFGLDGDVPVPADYSGDGGCDMAVFRPSVGGWYVIGQSPIFFGLTGDVPVPADYDGDAIADLAIFRPSVGGWYRVGASTTFFGLNGDIPVPGDYDGNATADVAIFRPSVGGWYRNGASTAFLGLATDVPVSGDYDGNATTDIAVFRPSTGGWFVQAQAPVFFGSSGDRALPLPSAIRQSFFP